VTVAEVRCRTAMSGDRERVTEVCFNRQIVAGMTAGAIKG
jgi:hypothetical protein